MDIVLKIITPPTNNYIKKIKTKARIHLKKSKIIIKIDYT